MKSDPFKILSEKKPALDLDKLNAYAGEILDWNRTIRLVGPKDLMGVRLQIADALFPFLIEEPDFPLLDIGSGAGLPAIPIAIAFPAAEQIVCVESRSKRASFIRHAARQLKLDNIKVVCGRCEEAAALPGLGGAFKTSTARAVAGITAILKLSEPFLADSGRVFLPRGDEPAPDVPGWFKLVDREYDLSSEIGLRRLAVYSNCRN